MSRYPKSRYPWVPCPKPEPTKSVGSTMPPGIRRAGARGEGRGLGMVATCTFPAGSAIAEFSCPLLVFPDEAHVHTMCDWCLRPGFPAGSMSGTLVAGTLSDYLPKVKLSACTGCKYVVYCSKDCQAAAWRSIHKLECPALRNVAGIAGARGKAWSVPTQVRAAVKLLLRLKRGDADVRDAVGEVPFFGSRDASRVEMRKGRLESNKEAFRRYNGGKLWERIKNEARAVMMIAGVMVEGGGIAASAKQEVMNDWVTELLCKLQTNAFDIMDPDTDVGGIFLDPDLALANHSCIPNAYVCFAGRKAILRAETDIKEGEEIEISYIENNHSKEERHRFLELYHFACQCRRCKNDLDVYQVCQSSPVIHLNSLSLQPDLRRYSNPPIDRTALQVSSYQSVGLKSDDIQRQKYRALINAKMFAAEPLASALHELGMRYGAEEGNFAYSLSLACFRATRCHPYSNVGPFDPWRVKGMLLIAQLLSQTAPLSMMGELAQICPNPKLVDRLSTSKMDQVSICETILRLVIYYGPMAHSDDWEWLKSARELLDDIEKLPGREQESAVIKAWSSQPEHPEAKAFFREQILQPINDLADFAIEIMVEDLTRGNRTLPNISRSSRGASWS